MNIFVTDKCPIKSAKFLDDCRCNKMILESAQMLFTAIHIHNQNNIQSYDYSPLKRIINDSKFIEHNKNVKIKKIYYLNGIKIYSITHLNHPCSIWTRTSRGNYKWLVDHFKALCDEYTRRYSKTHKCEQYYQLFLDNMIYIPENGLTPFSNCTTLKEEKDIYKAYRLYLQEKWKNDKRMPTWR